MYLRLRVHKNGDWIISIGLKRLTVEGVKTTDRIKALLSTMEDFYEVRLSPLGFCSISPFRKP